MFYNAWNYDTNEPISLCNGLIGDSNHDGEISVLDIVLIVNHIIGLDFLTQDSICGSDFNSDFSVDILDIVLIVSNILGE